ncbi:MAG: methyltransferase domain-containing protein [Solirubrobacteraceae bacterium MAG38_C4-C5]|nr:methyltransferase domain-containing protein [Candidatus Siliceabacter maunaloa]
MSPELDIASFYDALAPWYATLFADFTGEADRQGDVLRALIDTSHEVVDLAAGVGTQAVPLAKRGFAVRAFDLSVRAIAELRARAAAESVTVEARQHDLEEGLPDLVGQAHLAFLLVGNSAAFLSDTVLKGLLRRIAEYPRTSVLIGSCREYDMAVFAAADRGTCVFEDSQSGSGIGHLVTHRWYARGGDEYDVEVEIRSSVKASSTAGDVRLRTSAHARDRDRMTALLETPGLSVRWLEPADTGFYQPIYLASPK